MIMKKLILIATFPLFIFLYFACTEVDSRTPLEQVLALYRKDVDSFARSVQILAERSAKSEAEDIQEAFRKSRLAYKRVEWLTAYYQPFTARQINGPALPEVEPSDKAVVIEPEGFQVIEELLFPQLEDSNRAELVKQVHMLLSTSKRLQVVAGQLETTDAHVLDALRLQVFRVLTLGITGFDSPVAQQSVPEAAACLRRMDDYLAIYASGTSDSLKRSLHTRVERCLQLLELQDFAGLDRMSLITGALNPLSEGIHQLQKALHLPFFSEPRALRAEAATLFGEQAFNPGFFTPDAAAQASPEKVALGERLFYETRLSKNGQRSCGSCHQPAKAFSDGIRLATTLDGKAVLSRNTPTLINAALQPFQFYDMRVGFLEDQAADVIRNRDEMHGDLGAAARLLSGDSAYRRLFSRAYADTPSAASIQNALASYLRTLVSFRTPFDRYVRGERNQLTAQQVEGFNLFAGKAKCATCHFIPLFNGLNPPEFMKMDAEILGVPADARNRQLDRDEGRFATYRIPLHRFAFKTPTLRNAARTAPYMHNGAYATLEEVIDFYNRGGGIGMGFDVPNQTLPPEPLHLSASEKQALVAFLKSLSEE